MLNDGQRDLWNSLKLLGWEESPVEFGSGQCSEGKQLLQGCQHTGGVSENRNENSELLRNAVECALVLPVPAEPRFVLVLALKCFEDW